MAISNKFLVADLLTTFLYHDQSGLLFPFQETIMNLPTAEKRLITPANAVEILRKNGTKVSMEEAEIILDFMYKMSNLTVENFSNSKVKQGSHTQE
ncbi:MAG: hypothetical protein M3O71_15295 [Bacteroidota bacterium]|nr:hypothetical protein [Bacteroidota bacterium]